MSGGGSSGTTQTNTVQKSDPWPGQASHLTDIYADARRMYNATPQTAYSGPLVAGPTTGQKATNTAIHTAGGQQANTGQGLTTTGGNLLTDQLGQPGLPTMQEGADPTMLSSLGGNRLNIADNQYLMPALMGNIEYGAGKIRDIALPQLSQDAQTAGAYGGSRHGQREGTIVSDFERNASDAIAQATLGAYNTERGIEAQQEGQRFGASAARNQQADSLNATRNNLLLGMAPELMAQGTGMQTAGLGLQQQAGLNEQGWNQDQIDAALQKYNMGLDAKWQGLKQYAGLVGGALPGSVSSTSTAPRPSAAGGAIGGALGGAALGSAILPGWGTAGGALLGALGGWL